MLEISNLPIQISNLIFFFGYVFAHLQDVINWAQLRTRRTDLQLYSVIFGSQPL